MKKSTVLFIIIATLVTGTFAFAQNSNFIEITVSDTVTLKPVAIQYLISEGSADYSYDYNDQKKEENKHADQTKLTQVEKILTSNKFIFSDYTESKSYRISDNEYDIYSKKGGAGILVQLKSIKELESLYVLLKEQKGIEGKILDMSFESGDNYMDQLFKGLFNKAQKEAQSLGSLTGLKIGKVISISEVNSNQSYSILDWYQDIFAFGKYEEGLFGKELTRLYTRKLTFKFETN